MPRPWENLSDFEFEGFVGDLLGVDFGIRFERFTRGHDGGVDLRHIPTKGGRIDIVQVKHFLKSTYPELRREVKKEAGKIARGDTKPRSYRLVTSRGLTPGNKTELAGLLAPWVTRDDQILGREDIESLLDKHPDVERRHVKLWLTSGTHLSVLVQAGTHARSRVLAQDIQRTLPLYVQSESFVEAEDRLRDSGVVLIAGEPGIGKTTLARMLVAAAIVDGYEPIEVSSDIDEAWSVWDPNVRQVFLYDDFLGRTVLGELAKNEDSRLLSFMSEVSRASTTLFVLTTREYILQEAAQASEAFRRHGLEHSRFLLSLDTYSPLDRAKILHNHVWHSDLPAGAKRELAVDRGYTKIVEHKNFNPRLVEYVTGQQPGHPIDTTAGSWLQFAVDALDHPTEIWRQAYEKELADEHRALLLCHATMPDDAQIDDLERAFESWAETVGLPSRAHRFERTLQVVDDSFTQSVRMEDGTLMIRTINPGLSDFLERELVADVSLVRAALSSAVFIEQVQRTWRFLEKATHVVRSTVAQDPDVALATRRLVEKPGATWLGSRYSDETVRYHRYGSADMRLHWLLGVAGEADAPVGAADLASELVEKLLEKWRQGLGDIAEAAQLADRLATPGEVRVPSDWRDALVAGVADPAFLDAWEAVVSLAEDMPETFTANVMEGVKQRFQVFASDELDERYNELESEDEISRLEEVAAAFGVGLDEVQIERARERIEERMEREDQPEEQRLSRVGTRSSLEVDERATMDAMFSRFSD